MSIKTRLQQAWGAMFGSTPSPVAEAEQRFDLRTESAEWRSLGFNPSVTGVSVTAQSAMQQATVYACVRVLAESVAMLPWLLYRSTAAGKERAREHPLYRILHDTPNDEMSSFELRETLMGHLLLRGNAYCEIEMNNRGDVRALWPLRPDRTQPVRDDRGALAYQTQLPGGDNVTLPAPRVLHLRGLSSNGIMGMSPIALARESIGLAMATEQFGAAFFGNGARPGGVLEHPGKLGDKARETLKKGWNESHGGLSNAQRMAVLEEGMKLHEVGIAPDEAQFLETRKYERSEICGWFRVPAHMVNDLERATFSNIEHMSIAYAVYSLTPWLTRIDQSVYRQLLSEPEQKTYFSEFLINGLMRGDAQSRYTAYGIGLQNGFLSINDVRDYENLNRVEGGDVHFVPLNMTPLGTAIAPSASATPTADRAGLHLLVHDAATRIARRCADRDENKHREWFADVLLPVVRALVRDNRNPRGVVGELALWWFDTPDADARALTERIIAACAPATGE